MNVTDEIRIKNDAGVPELQWFGQQSDDKKENHSLFIVVEHWPDLLNRANERETAISSNLCQESKTLQLIY